MAQKTIQDAVVAYPLYVVARDAQLVAFAATGDTEANRTLGQDTLNKLNDCMVEIGGSPLF